MKKGKCLKAFALGVMLLFFSDLSFAASYKKEVLPEDKTEAGETQSRIRLEKVILKTYPFSDPDPVARPGPLYPYFRFHGYSLKGEARTWRMVLMENPYLEIMVAPEIGGKVWGAREKTTGFDFIYWNPVVKFREIALRGPWTSGGIEFNFGLLGHAATTATPVDFLLEENEDGSVSCVVSASDWPSRTRWFVRIRLPRDQAVIETEGFWFNPTPFHHPLYHWMTAAAPVGHDLHFYHPGQYFIGHDGVPGSWPVSPEGRDLSYYRNNNFGGSKSYHLLGEYGEFFAGLWEEKALGYGHFAFYPDKPGMKLWLWSQARDGAIWRDLLTDFPAPQYIEMQTGLLYNQTAAASSSTPFKHAFFSPYHVFHWKEYWFPIKGLKKVVAASPSGALNVEISNEGRETGAKTASCPENQTSPFAKVKSRDSEAEKEPLGMRNHVSEQQGSGTPENNNPARNKKIFLEFSPVITGEKELKIKINDQIIYQEKMRLRPLVLWQKEFEVPQTENLAVIIGAGEIEWRSDEASRSILHRPVRSPEDFDWSSAEGRFLMGEELARQRRFSEAFLAYQDCLKKEPSHVRALTRLAELELRANRLKEALELARRVLMIDAYDPEANFIYGVINRRLGNLADALDGLSWASRSLDFRSGAFTEMAEIYFLKGDFWRAKEFLRRALKAEPENMASRELEIIILRKEGKKEEARAKIKEALEIEPLNHLARFEAYLLEPEEKKKEHFLQFITSELPHETFLELALRYERLGLLREAITLLELGPEHPLIDLTLAYLLREIDGTRSRYFLTRALTGDEKRELRNQDRTRSYQARIDSLPVFSPEATLKSQAEIQPENLPSTFILNESGQNPAIFSSSHASFVPVFPFRQEMIASLNWARNEQPHWKLNYWLALVFWNLGRNQEAQELFLACGNEPDSEAFYLTRAHFLMSQGKEEEASADLKRARELKPQDWRAVHLLINYFERKGEDKLALELAREIYPLYPENSALILDLARNLLRNGRLQEMLSFFTKIVILPYEGAWEGHDLYRQANLLMAAQAMARAKWSEAHRFLRQARSWPENLGSGRPYQPDERIELYLEGLIYEKQKRRQQALSCWQKIVAGWQDELSQPSLVNLISALAWKKLGNLDKASSLREQWVNRWPQWEPLRWAGAIFAEDYDEAQRVVQNWLEKYKKKSLWNLAEADHHWPLFVEIFKLIKECK
jgi:tetratricopeptide (TPR) repeat protein